MIIKIEAANQLYRKKLKTFCGQISCGNLQPIKIPKPGEQTQKYEAQAEHIKKNIRPMMKRQNHDVPQKVKNEIRELIQAYWKSWKDMFDMPADCEIKISFPDAIEDCWKSGQVYYIFPGAYSENKVITF